MLDTLHVRNFATIEDMAIEFRGQMTVLTGETGAGKSILIDALGSALGDRGQRIKVRHGSDSAEITAVFNVADNPPARSLLATWKIEDHDQDCIIRRQITADGRSRAFINGTPVPLRSLQELGAQLVDVHGQHAQHSLLRMEVQRQLVDEYGGHDEILQALRSAYLTWRDTQQRLQSIATSVLDRPAQLELLRYQVHELANLDIPLAETDKLLEEHRVLCNLGNITECCAAVYGGLDDNESGLVTRTVRLVRDLENVVTLDERLLPVVELLDNARIHLTEAGDELGRYLESLNADPERLRLLEEKISLLHALARKHNVAIGGLAGTLNELNERLATLERSAGEIDELRQRSAHTLAAYRERSAALHQQRRQTAAALCEAVNRQLGHLGLGEAEIVIEVALDSASPPSACGDDRVEFLFKSGRGQTPLPLGRIASGGELSRISLAIEVSAAHVKGVPTLVFDEVDVGIGGGIAEVVGKQLRQLSENRQILCITHLPQVASQGHHHYKVAKNNLGGKTLTLVQELGHQERIDEVARMLGGLNITPQTLAHAREMLSG